MTTLSKQRRLLATVAAIVLPTILAVSQTEHAAAAPSPETLGMRPSGSFLKQDRLDQYERELGRPINWYVGMAGRSSPADMKGSVYGQMQAKDAVLPKIAHRMDVVMTVPLAFGKGSARDAAGRSAIRAKLLETANGNWDADYRKVAETLVAGGYPDAVIRLGHEFTGAWYPWSSQGNEDAYIKAFRNVHDVMQSVAPLLRFDWNPARNTFGEFGPGAYPGDAYVDVISMDVYYEPWKGDPSPLTNDVWQRRYKKVLEAHRDFAAQHGKPVAYPEWANGDVDTPEFIDNMYTWFSSLPKSGPGRLLYHSYFNVSNGTYDLDRYPKSKSRYLKQFGVGDAGGAATPPPTAPPTATTVPVTTVPPTTAPARTAGATADQFTFWDQRVVHRADQYATLDANAPADWANPKNFVDGNAYLRLDIVDKPSDLLVEVLVCMWRDNYNQEKCASAGKFTAGGESWIRLRSPDLWWKRDRWDWNRPMDAVRILVKDAATGQLLTSSKCGNACYRGGDDLSKHTPIVFDGEMVIVAPGADLQPLPNWGRCPTGFSVHCTNTNTPMKGVPSVSIPPTMTASAGRPVVIPAAIDADTVTWSKVSGSSLQWSSRNVAQPTVTFSSAGKYVLRVVAARDNERTRADVTVTVGTATSPATTVPAPAPVPTTAIPTIPPPAAIPTIPPSTGGPTVSARMNATIDQPITIPADIAADWASWWRVSGAAMLWSDRNAGQPTVTFRSTGTYLLRVNVGTGDDRASADVVFTVGKVAQPTPTTTSPPTSIPTMSPQSDGPEIVVPRTLDAFVNEPVVIPADIDADAIEWRKVSGTAIAWSSRTVAQPTVNFRTPGKYLLRVTARRRGTVMSADIDVTIRRQP